MIGCDQTNGVSYMIQSELPSNPKLHKVNDGQPEIIKSCVRTILSSILDGDGRCSGCALETTQFIVNIGQARSRKVLTEAGGWPALVNTRKTSVANLPDTALRSSQSTS